MQCPASVRLTMGIADKSNSAAQRGTYIHKMGEDMLNGKGYGVGGTVTDDSGLTTHIDAEMMNEANAYVGYVNDIIDSEQGNVELIVEADIDIFPEYDLGGHADAVILTDNTLHVIDLKTGRIPVSAENNSQLMLYAYGLYTEYSFDYEFEKVILHIVQSNCNSGNNTNSHKLSLDELLEFSDHAMEKAKLALQEDSTCSPSTDACEWCGYNGKCKALLAYTNELLGDFKNLDADEVPIADVIDLVKNEKLITGLISAYKKRMQETLEAGEEIPGYKLVEQRKNKTWVDEINAYEKLKTWMKVDDFTTRKIATPTQVIKLLGNGISTRKKNVLDSLWTVPSGTVVMAPESDKRPAVKPIEDEFEDLGE
jgi:hypothetical protein